MQDIKSFNEALNQFADDPVSLEDAGEAFHNLSGFMSLLMKINEREQIVPTRPAGKAPRADQ
ncbi:MAG: hypothetical protein ACT4OY_06070 [Alphaproteobacteria bacterium]